MGPKKVREIKLNLMNNIDLLLRALMAGLSAMLVELSEANASRLIPALPLSLFLEVNHQFLSMTAMVLETTPRLHVLPRVLNYAHEQDTFTNKNEKKRAYLSIPLINHFKC